jgi:oxaloacetate decarboxylase gamma subunit
MEQGFVLLVVGMGVVFCFLIILVYAVQAMGAILSKIAPEPEPSPSRPKSAHAIDPARIVAVAAAQRFRSGN